VIVTHVTVKRSVESNLIGLLSSLKKNNNNYDVITLEMAYLTARFGLRTCYWRSAACLRLYSNSAKQTEGIVKKEGEEQGLERVTPGELVGKLQR